MICNHFHVLRWIMLNARTQKPQYIWNPFVWSWIFSIVDSICILICIENSELGRNSLVFYPSPFCILLAYFYTKLTKYTHTVRFHTHTHLRTQAYFIPYFPILLLFSIPGIGSEMEFFTYILYRIFRLLLLLQCTVCWVLGVWVPVQTYTPAHRVEDWERNKRQQMRL